MADSVCIDQSADRDSYIQLVLASESDKRLIVAGPGTGKTTLFQMILSQAKTKNNLVMTFINKLTEDMKCSLSDKAKVQTFHSYSVGLLHKFLPKWRNYPAIDQIIESDIGLKAQVMGSIFHNLDESNPRIKLYLKRALYYKAFGFNDAIYRVLKKAKQKTDLIPLYENILIDEFQDFSALEVALIKQFEGHGNLIIVGDDDQSIYPGKSESGRSIKDLYNSGEYDPYELPYCNRCPKVIVDATNMFLEKAVEQGHLIGRIYKPFVAFEPGKEEINKNFSKLYCWEMSSMPALKCFMNHWVANILENDLQAYNERNTRDPLILIIGSKKYLNKIEEELTKQIPGKLIYNKSKEICHEIYIGYDYLLKNKEDNLGWRIVLIIDPLPARESKRVISTSLTGLLLFNLLPVEYKEKHLSALELYRILRKNKKRDEKIEQDLCRLIGQTEFDKIINNLFESEEQDCSCVFPVVLSSFQGCKGLSADYVFMVGCNNGDIPSDKDNITDMEICEFAVALTRARKECYILPVYNYIGSTQNKSSFLSWIPSHMLHKVNKISLDKLKECIANSQKTN